MNIFKISLAFFCILVLAASAEEINNLNQTYCCKKIKDAPKLDGKLEDECWQKADRAQLAFLWDSEEGKAPSVKTEFMACHDDNNLYLGIELYETNMNGLVTKGSAKHDDVSWKEDAVEIFFDHDFKRKTYYQFMANHAGGCFDAKGPDAGWDMKWQSSVFKEKDRWSLEIAIPFNGFPSGQTPVKGSIWGFNLVRDKPDEHMTWVDTGPVFGTPKDFGLLVFDEATAYTEKLKRALEDETRRIEEKTQSLVNSEDASEWTGMVKVNTKIKRSGKGSFELFGKYPTELMSSRLIPVDLNKTYMLSAWMRSLDTPKASAYFGLRMYDANTNLITIYNVAVRSNTVTALAADGLKDSREIRVAKNTEWLKKKNSSVAFNVQDNYDDLPNYDVSKIKDVVDEGEHYKVILNAPLKKTYPSGTKVRLHSPYAGIFFWVADGWIPTAWKKFSTTMKGEALNGTPIDQFWRGTKYVRVIVLFGNYNRKPRESARLLVDDIKFNCE